MPELPDVEVYKQYFDATALHRRIEHVHVESPALLANTTPQGLGRALKHKTLQATRRHGKYLFIALNGSGWLVLHFGMTGKLKYFQHRGDTPAYTRLLIGFENGYHLAYIAPRKLGRIALVDSPHSLLRDRHLGPDALELGTKEFIELAAKRRGMVKPWLINQTIIAGIGNIYSDEILFQAGIHPRRAVSDLDSEALKRLYKAMRTVLKTAINARAKPDQMPSTFLLPCRKKGGSCPKCRTLLATVKAAGRTAWFCPRCQKI
ncbi:MAG: DNA-formamidopyrimidine glycosylase family protein [Granulosicoccaceae bacterium]|jgi:formamidopyrimidine-DNA glycosylase